MAELYTKELSNFITKPLPIEDIQFTVIEF